MPPWSSVAPLSPAFRDCRPDVRLRGEVPGPWACCVYGPQGRSDGNCSTVRPRRSTLGIVLELAELLRATAGLGDLRGPLDGGVARRELQDAEAAVELPGLGVGLVPDGS